MTSHQFPPGFRGTGVHCGIKRSGRPDLSLIVCDGRATAAGVYTQNLVRAAPVRWNERHTPSEAVRAVVINSGNANACTGEQGERDAAQMAAWAAKAVGASPEQVLVLSTGIIGAPLPMHLIQAGIDKARGQLEGGSEAVELAARGMLTTDKVPKIAFRSFDVSGGSRSLLGFAKGAAMIGPNMATMLAVLLTDAAIAPADAQAMLKEVVDVTFNCISVEGHMSTNDTVLLLARDGDGNAPFSANGLDTFRKALTDVCTDLAKAIPSDGEGATHLITIDVRGCRTCAEASAISRTVADSPLVKTAIHGADPNWGRIVSAAGYAGVDFDPAGLRLELNGTLLYESGTPVDFNAAAVSRSIADNRDTSVVLTFREGEASARHWTCDLTSEYVRLNADYHT